MGASDIDFYLCPVKELACIDIFIASYSEFIIIQQPIAITRAGKTATRYNTSRSRQNQWSVKVGEQSKGSAAERASE